MPPDAIGITLLEQAEARGGASRAGDAAARAARQRIPSDQVAYSDGRRMPLTAYARMLTTTVLSDAQRQAVINFVQGNQTDLVRVSQNGSVHFECAQYEGEILSVSGATPGFRTLDSAFGGGGLGHPNCVHTLEPVYNDGVSATDRLRSENLTAVIENALRLTRAGTSADAKRSVLEALRRALSPVFQISYEFVPFDDDPKITLTDPVSGLTETSDGL